jgi:tripartite ATP-independent transporter DctP family solute receptor
MPRLLTRRVFVTMAACLATPHIARAAPRRVRLGHANGKATPGGQGCRAFIAAVAAEPLLNTFLKVALYDDAELGDELGIGRGCQRGTIDMALLSTSGVGALAPEAALLDSAYLFRDAATARTVLDGEVGAQLAKILQPKGLNVLGWGENGQRNITANRPIKRPEDLIGLKIRVPPSEVEVASFRGLGADPRQLPFTALYEALRTGDVDAEENPIGNIEASRFYEVQKYLSLTRHIYSAFMFIASQDLLDDLSVAQQAALTACVRQGVLATRRVADAAERDGLVRLRAHGMTVVEDIDIAAFVAAAKPGLSAIGQKFGPDIMAQIMRAGA